MPRKNRRRVFIRIFVIRAFPVLFSCCLLEMQPAIAFEGDASEALSENRILSPTPTSPITVSSQGVIEVQVRLRLPLTPPPGVQQPKANKGWRVTLIEPDVYTLNGKRTSSRYEHQVMRLRPVAEDIYRLTVEVIPWLLPGRYDIEVTGPGFHGKRASAVTIGPPSGNPTAPPFSLKAADGGHLVISNRTQKSHRSSVHLRLDDDMPGIVIESKGKTLPPSDVAFASLSEENGPSGRVLSFPVSLPSPNTDGVSEIRWRWSPSAPPKCRGTIEWKENDNSAETMAWRSLAYLSDTSPRKVVWDFGDGRWGVGAEIRHRWLLTNEAMVTATAFHGQGQVCNTTAKKNLNTLRYGSSCACSTPARDRGKSPLWGLFFLFNRAVEE